MELTQLKYFYEAACTEHITRAAQQLHIAQPALTQAIHRLEGELQVPLFEPKGRNIALTAYGQYLKMKLEPFMETLEKLPEELERMAHLQNATIHMNVMSASSLVTSSIISYKRQTENVYFQLSQNQEMSFCDIEIYTRMPGRRKEKKSEVEYVFSEQIFLAVPNTGQYRRRKEIALEQMRQEGFICLAGFKQFRQICDQFCARAGFLPRIIFESDNVASVKNMIAAGIGIGFWPQFTWGELDMHDVLLLPLQSPECYREIVVCCNTKPGERPEVDRYFSYLLGYLKEWQALFPAKRIEA